MVWVACCTSPFVFLCCTEFLLRDKKHFDPFLHGTLDPPLMVIAFELVWPQRLVLRLSLKLQSWQVEEYGIPEIHSPVCGVRSGLPYTPQAVVATLLKYIRSTSQYSYSDALNWYTFLLVFKFLLTANLHLLLFDRPPEVPL